MASQNKLVVKNEYIKKPHQVIQIEGKLNFLQHKCWNILALNAFKKGIKDGQRKYEISLTEIYKLLGYKAENDKHLKDSLVAIMRIVIQGDIINKDGGSDWHAFVLLGHCYVEKGVCHYEYTTPVIDLLSNPKQYVKLLLKMQNRFSSGYSLKLYEFLKTRYIEKQGRGTTGELTLETFRSLMGVRNDDYTEFRDLKKRVLTSSIKEINEKTDLFVELKLFKNRQKIVGLEFQISENPNKKTNLQGLDLESLEEEMDLMNQATEAKNSNSNLKPKLEKLGFGENQIEKFLTDPETQKVLDCTDYVLFKLQKEIETGKTKNRIENPTGYFFTIYNAYDDIDFSSLEDWRVKQSKIEQEKLEWERKQKEEEEEKQRQAELSKLKQEKIDKYKQENLMEVEEICVEYLGKLQAENKTFILEQVKKEAKKLEISLVKSVQTHLLTKYEIDNKIWAKINPKPAKN